MIYYINYNKCSTNQLLNKFQYFSIEHVKNYKSIFKYKSRI